MLARLVLGCGSVGRRLALAETGHDEDVAVVTADEHRVETLRDEGISAERADPTDPAVLARFEAASVVAGDDDPARNVAIARAARASFPGAHLLAYAGEAPDDAAVARLEALADRVVDPRAAVASATLDRVGDDGARVRRLQRVLRSIDGELAVVTHDNPDPDAIASAVALVRLAERAGTPATACYYGEINHQENRALVNALSYDLDHLDADSDGDLRERFAGFALVDHSRPGVNDQLPLDLPVDVVIDHHPPRAPVEARFVDLRSDVGATSTLLADYYRRLNVDPPEPVATGLLFGIRVDTRDFAREVSARDFEAAASLVAHADAATLDEVESPSVSAETLSILAEAIRARELIDGALVSFVGEIGDRDALAQAADRLLDMEEVSITLVCGYSPETDTLYASGRARGTDVDLGEALRDAFDQIGSAGGHADMAGAQIPIGALVEPDESPDERAASIREVVRDRFHETLGVGDHTVPTVDGDEEAFGADAWDAITWPPGAWSPDPAAPDDEE
jgi:nanoRNase/pAp phosphatase (c-di-AMP/oligoRNAs hydrolase)